MKVSNVCSPAGKSYMVPNKKAYPANELGVKEAYSAALDVVNNNCKLGVFTGCLAGRISIDPKTRKASVTVDTSKLEGPSPKNIREFAKRFAETLEQFTFNGTPENDFSFSQYIEN